ncbi:Retinal-specific ATP-binding cassette transporter, partial [Araneus ventricosus]
CDKKKKHQFLGYCPQKDALDGLLTPRQHLEIYAGLRGIHSSEVPKIIERSLKSLELDTHADRPVHKLSGGTKRKLCTAIATLGDPELVLLKEKEPRDHRPKSVYVHGSEGLHVSLGPPRLMVSAKDSGSRRQPIDILPVSVQAPTLLFIPLN